MERENQTYDYQVIDLVLRSIAFLQKLDFFFFGNFVKVVVDLVNDFNPLFFNFSNGE